MLSVPARLSLLTFLSSHNITQRLPTAFRVKSKLLLWHSRPQCSGPTTAPLLVVPPPHALGPLTHCFFCQQCFSCTLLGSSAYCHLLQKAFLASSWFLCSLSPCKHTHLPDKSSVGPSFSLKDGKTLKGFLPGPEKASNTEGQCLLS